MAVELKFERYVKNPEFTHAMLVTPEVLKLLPMLNKEDIAFMFKEDISFESAGDYVVLSRSEDLLKSLIEVGSYIVHRNTYNAVYSSAAFESYVQVGEARNE